MLPQQAAPWLAFPKIVQPAVTGRVRTLLLVLYPHKRRNHALAAHMPKTPASSFENHLTEQPRADASPQKQPATEAKPQTRQGETNAAWSNRTVPNRSLVHVPPQSRDSLPRRSTAGRPRRPILHDSIHPGPNTATGDRTRVRFTRSLCAVAHGSSHEGLTPAASSGILTPGYWKMNLQ